MGILSPVGVTVSTIMITVFLNQIKHGQKTMTVLHASHVLIYTENPDLFGIPGPRNLCKMKVRKSCKALVYSTRYPRMDSVIVQVGTENLKETQELVS